MLSISKDLAAVTLNTKKWRIERYNESFSQARLSSRLVTADVFVTSWQKILLYRVLWTSYGRSENKMKICKNLQNSKIFQNSFKIFLPK